jgi:hypothetical protein
MKTCGITPQLGHAAPEGVSTTSMGMCGMKLPEW